VRIWQATCAERKRQQDAAQVAQQQQEAAAAQARAQAEQAAQAESEQERAIEKASSRGYKLIPSIKDLMLDGKELADNDAKIQISGFYKRTGDNGVLYGSMMDAYQNTNNYFPLITDDAQRALRAHFLSDGCAQIFGCKVDIGGHMTTCKHLAAEMANYPPMPCLNVEVEIVYRPGD